jgi:hypothetical protein
MITINQFDTVKRKKKTMNRKESALVMNELSDWPLKSAFSPKPEGPEVNLLNEKRKVIEIHL